MSAGTAAVDSPMTDLTQDPRNIIRASGEASNPVASVIAPTARETKLRLLASKAMPRELVIGFDFYGVNSFHGHAHAFIGDRSIAYAGTHDFATVRLSYNTAREASLWLHHAQFDLTESEAAEVERALGPLGIRITRDEPQS